MTSNDFNFIAPFYDFLKKLIFGKKLDLATYNYISAIPPNSKVLIVGGGSGEILEKLAEHDTTLQIHYIEKSSRMIRKSKKQDFKTLKVDFVNADILDYHLSTYRVIITPFVLDVFDEQNLSDLIDKLYSALENEGLWICTDFQISPQTGIWRPILIKWMILFFRIVARIQSKKLADFQNIILKKKRMKLMDSKEVIGGMVKSSLIKKEAN